MNYLTSQAVCSLHFVANHVVQYLKPVVSNCHNNYCNKVILSFLVPLSSRSLHRPHDVSQSTDLRQSIDRRPSVN